MNRHLLYPACLLGGIALTWAGVAFHRFIRRDVKPHPLAPVVPLPTGHVKVMDRGESA